jgi:hypothetical protein
MKWADFYFPPINLWCYPKQYEDYKMHNEETNFKPGFVRTTNGETIMITEETTVKPVWKQKENNTQVGGDHYKNMVVQPWEVMASIMTREEFIGFLKGNIIKYSLRAGKKLGANDDGHKAMHYMAKLAEVQKNV